MVGCEEEGGLGAAELLNGEFETSEFLVTCLKLELVRRGDAALMFGLVGSAEGCLSGESRLWIWRGNHPLALELMIESRSRWLAGLGKARLGGVGEGPVAGADIVLQC